MADENSLAFERDLALRQAKQAQAALQVIRMTLTDARPQEALRRANDEIDRLEDELDTIEEDLVDTGDDSPSLDDASEVLDDELALHLQVAVNEARNENWEDARTSLDSALARAEWLTCDGAGGDA